METLIFDEPLPFGSSWNKTEESHSYRRAYLKRDLPPSFLFLQRMTLDCARAPYRSLWAAGAPRGRGTSRDGRSALRGFGLDGASRLADARS